MHDQNVFICKPIGVVHSQLKRLEDCPLQEHEGAPDALLEIAPEFVEGIKDILAGTELTLLTWFHVADRTVLKCRRRNETDTPMVGVFSTRSPDRPNPVGIHHVKVLEATEQGLLKVFPLEALDGTPILDIKIFMK